MNITPKIYDEITRCDPSHVAITSLLAKSLAVSPEKFKEVVDLPQDGEALKGITPLCMASYLGKDQIVRALLEQGADVNSLDKNGATALMYAARDGHCDVVRVLLEFHARHDIRDINGWQAIQYGQSYPEITNLLEEDAVKKEGAFVSVLSKTLEHSTERRPQGYFSEISKLLRKPYLVFKLLFFREARCE